ncbi:chemotaxis protein CheB [Marilutibacter chinensis]|uniref:CheB-type methylesterase domain-containing protein n=1 Tax=Marilutibacter chinensis TaxID=2912247 RepID=A0ABS9HUR2_9GAMM|nr:chemotaxis protein CheB [Lysobacter chinensis]MCF7221959.1 hypothetical protein [Lysobacter chinensis]
MTEPVRRVALLVRHAAAGERLRTLLAEAGIESVLQGDPTEIAVESLTEASPEVVLVALDPDIEDALERFDSVLGNPGIDVIYEEAELAAAREGWEAARWKRHLLAKLQGHDRVLPPRPDGSHDEPGLRLQSAPDVSDEDYAAFDPIADAAGPLDEWSNATEAAANVTPAAMTLAEPEASSAASVSGEVAEDAAALESFEVSYAFDPVNAEGADAGGGAGDGFSPGLEISFESDGIELDAGEETEFGDGGTGGFEIVFDEGGDTASTARGSDQEPILGLDEHLRSLSLDEPQNEDAGDDAPVASVISERDAPAADGISMTTTGFGELTLDDGTGSYATAETRAADERFGRDLADLDQRIASLELVEDHAAGGGLPGAVLVLAGIGGPDAVRQLLGALPVDFPRPVLVQQRLDGGRYDRLVAQMQRATTLPVHLAEPGRMAMAGFVYVLPAGLGLESVAEGLRFLAEGEVLSALPSADSAVLMLSGSDPADVDAVLKHRIGGALVAGQSPEGCYDPAAPDQLAVRGGELAPPAELALRLAGRWPG